MMSKVSIVFFLLSIIPSALLAQDKYTVEVRRVVIELNEGQVIGKYKRSKQAEPFVFEGTDAQLYGKKFRYSSAFSEENMKIGFEKALNDNIVPVTGYGNIFRELNDSDPPTYAIAFFLKELEFTSYANLKYMTGIEGRIQQFYANATFRVLLLDLRLGQLVYANNISIEYLNNETGFPAGDQDYSNYFPGLYDAVVDKLLSDSTISNFLTKNETVSDSLITNSPILIPKNTISKAQSMQEVLNATVTLKTGNSHGSGAIISSDGLILTCHHVINASEEVEVILSNGIAARATVVRSIPEYDLALLQLVGMKTVPIAISNSKEIAIGQDAWVIGTPGFTDLGQTVSKGIISGNRTIDGKNYLQTDASVSPGNSGGPLLNDKLEIIGIVNAKVVSSGMEGIGFAIPMSVALEKLNIVLK